jgi:hypothetical protein
MAVADFTVVGEGDLPPPALVASAAVATGSPDAEQWEGVVVRLTDAEVTNTTDVGPGKFQVDDAAIISDYFIYPENSFNAQVGQVYAAITGPLLYSFNEFQVCPRTLSDLSDGGDTDTTDTETTDPTDTDTSTGDDKVTIYDIQQGKFNLQDIVTVEGVVATSGLTFKKDGFFVQDPMGGEYSGIFVYINMSGHRRRGRRRADDHRHLRRVLQLLPDQGHQPGRRRRHRHRPDPRPRRRRPPPTSPPAARSPRTTRAC